MDDIKKVAWNASEGIIFEISNRRTAANLAYVKGDLRAAFHNLKAIRLSVVQSFTDEERLKLTFLEERFRQVTPALTSNFSRSFNRDKKSIFNEAFVIGDRIFMTYNDLLMDLLNIYGYLVAEQKDASRMKW